MEKWNLTCLNYSISCREYISTDRCAVKFYRRYLDFLNVYTIASCSFINLIGIGLYFFLGGGGGGGRESLCQVIESTKYLYKICWFHIICDCRVTKDIENQQDDNMLPCN